jgi:hypothetical protein
MAVNWRRGSQACHEGNLRTGLRTPSKGADHQDVSRAVELPRRARVRNVAVALAVFPGFLWGIGWLVFGFSGLRGLVRDLCVRGLGVLLVAAACNCAWRLAKDSRVGQAFFAYVACFAIAFVVLWALSSFAPVA